MYLRQIITRYLQNHKEVVLDFPPTGIVVLSGENSNGKSVVVKATRYLLSGKLNKPRVRSALVNHNATCAEIIYVRSDDTVLTVRISRSASTTYVMYASPGEEPITKYISDKSYLDLVHKFGWHYDKEWGISLNIAENDDSLLFYKTSHKVNGSVVQTATTDTVAEGADINIDNTLKEVRVLRSNYIEQISTINTTLSGLKIEPVEPLHERKSKLEWCLRNLKHIVFPKIPDILPIPKLRYVNVFYPTLSDIKPIPNVKYVKIYDLELPEVVYPKVVDISVNIPDIVQVALDLKDLREKRCPTCGRRFDCVC